MVRTRGQFPSEQAVLKVLYLAVRNLEGYRRPNVGIRSSAGRRRSKRSPCTSRGGSPPHKTATVTYTDGRTLPGSQGAVRLVSGGIPTDRPAPDT